MPFPSFRAHSLHSSPFLSLLFLSSFSSSLLFLFFLLLLYFTGPLTITRIKENLKHSIGAGLGGRSWAYEPSFPLLPGFLPSGLLCRGSRVCGALRLLWVSVESEGGGKKSSGERNSRIRRDRESAACMHEGGYKERE